VSALLPRKQGGGIRVRHLEVSIGSRVSGVQVGADGEHAWTTRGEPLGPSKPRLLTAAWDGSSAIPFIPRRSSCWSVLPRTPAKAGGMASDQRMQNGQTPCNQGTCHTAVHKVNLRRALIPSVPWGIVGSGDG
jgi:hypothetical protein